jgi:nicotinate-nucleotide adenylyltransferase
VKKLGILGGSFNPIHLGHLILAETAREALRLERVIFVPAKLPPHKRAAALAGGADRLAMVRLAIAGNPALAVSDIELRRPGVSYSVDTVRALRQKFGAGTEIYFLIGMDTVAELTGWREIARLARLCKFVPLSRPVLSIAEGPVLSIAEGPPHAAPDAAALKRAVGRGCARAILKRALPMPLIGISSSEIRRRIAEGRTIRYLVPDAVAAYIRRKRLYLLPAARTQGAPAVKRTPFSPPRRYSAAASPRSSARRRRAPG